MLLREIQRSAEAQREAEAQLREKSQVGMLRCGVEHHACAAVVLLGGPQERRAGPPSSFLPASRHPRQSPLLSSCWGVRAAAASQPAAEPTGFRPCKSRRQRLPCPCPAETPPLPLPNAMPQEVMRLSGQLDAEMAGKAGEQSTTSIMTTPR